MAAPDFLERVKRDLASFADPLSQVEVTDRGAKWTQDRRPREVVFGRSGNSEEPDVIQGERKYSYREFFASDRMADLRGLAEAIFYQMDPKVASYVDSSARRESTGETSAAPMVIRDAATKNLPYLRTRVVFLRGGAGAGKTVTLQQLAWSQAGALLEGGGGPLFLYIDAQKRALARFDEAVAILLQDLRAHFTYEAVATLTRLDLLVPVVDGFDELLGAGGYAESFSSLLRFLARLHGRGVMVASARSTFYDFGGFQEAAHRVRDTSAAVSFEIDPIDVLPWTDLEISRYIESSGILAALHVADSYEILRRLREAVTVRASSLLESPFFVTSLLTVMRESGGIPADRRAMTAVIEHFVQREVDKLITQQDENLLSLPQHLRLLEILAEEMWWEETRSLDPETIRTLAAMACEEFSLPAHGARTVIDKMTSHAFLATSVVGGQRGLAFAHEHYYSFFLGRYLANTVAASDRLEDLLSRSTLSSTTGTEFGHAITELSIPLSLIVERLANRKLSPLTRDLNRSNAGVLVAGVMRVHSLRSPSLVREVSIVNEDLSLTSIEDVRFERCELISIRLVGANWKRVVLSETTLTLPIIDLGTTRLDGTELRIPEQLVGIVVRRGEVEESEFKPEAVMTICRTLGVSIPGAIVAPTARLSPVAEETIHLLKRFLRKASVLNNVSREDLQNHGLLQREEWTTLDELLQRHEVITQVVIQRRGPSGVIYRLRYKPSVIEAAESGVSPHANLLSLWAALRAL